MNLTQHIKNGFDNRYTKAETETKIVELSPKSIAKSTMLSGTASVTNTTLMAGMATKLYTGNGTSQSIDAGVDLATQWGDTANETYGGLVWGKSRSGTTSNSLSDTIRGVNNTIFTNLTNANDTTLGRLTSFNANGFTIGSDGQYNTASATYASWIFQTTHRVSGTTNHGKAYTCHYNPITGFTMVKYEGSGIAGHEIPHHLGRELGFWSIKNLETTTSWISNYREDGYLWLTMTNAEATTVGTYSNTESYLTLSTQYAAHNNASQQHILYGWANSYYDDAGELNGNYEIGTYQGTGASGNKVTTRGKPAWIMMKRLDDVGNWIIADNQRTLGVFDRLYANTSDAESTNTVYTVSFENDGFTVGTTGVQINELDGQYLYFIVYDNDSGSGKSKFNMASETSNIQFNNLVVSFTNGVNSNGVVSTISNLGSLTFSPTGGWDI